jgi:Uma2 family endonuclease
MASEHAIILADDLRIPADAMTFEGFRRWCQSPGFPETGRIDYLAGDIEVDMSPEDLHTHGIVKVAMVATLQTIVADRDLGEVFTDRTRVASRFAALSVEPDLVVVLWKSLQSGRLRYVPAASQEPDRYVEIEGPPDVVVEIVSDSSTGKDTKRLPPLYARAGVQELWIANVRGERMRFDIHALREDGYEVVKPEAAGWRRSEQLGLFLRLTRHKTPVGTWRYRLEQR